MDKSVEQFFDKSMLKFFSNNEIIVSTVDWKRMKAILIQSLFWLGYWI
jgi:hypothetical protein